MSKQERRVPELRFKGFFDDWEQRKLETVTTKIGSGKTPKGGSEIYQASGIAFLRSQNINNNSVSFNDIVYIDENTNSQMINSAVLTNDILLNITGASIGRSAVYKYSNQANVNQHVCIIRPNNSVNPYFIQLNLTSEKGQKQIDNNQAGGGREGLNFKQIGKMKFHYPILHEQIKVAELFGYLDKLIVLHQRKTTTLNKIKKIYFEKLFSIDKKLLPKLRFKYYDKLWELRKLENLIEESGSGGTPKSTNSEYYNGNIPFLSISDISKSNGYINSTEKYITETGLKNSAAWIVPKGAVSLAMYASVGKVAILNIDATTSQAFYNMVFDNDNLRDFVYHRLNKANELNEWVRLISTGTQSNLNAKKVKNFEITLPANNEEISKISSIFNNLETNINLNKRKVKLLLKIKQAYLKKVFI